MKYVSLTLAIGTKDSGNRPGNMIALRPECIEAITPEYEESLATVIVTTSGDHWTVMEDFKTVIKALGWSLGERKEPTVTRFFHHDDPAIQAAMIILDDCRKRSVDSDEIPSEGDIANIIRSCYAARKKADDFAIS